MTMSGIHSLLLRRLRGNAVIVGIGNPNCRDDGIGRTVIEKLNRSSHIKVIDAGDSPEMFLDRIVENSPDVVMFVDCADLGSKPGSAAVIEPKQLNPGWGNGHQPSLSAIMTFVTEISGADTFLLGIQPEDISAGSGISPAVSQTAEHIVECIRSATFEKEAPARGK
ncbi:MAG: hydrogenase maturation protease [Acidobacteria bacterium]|nr:hydrogenase maturation protease [Acidobacteriota bacterium]